MAALDVSGALNAPDASHAPDVPAILAMRLRDLRELLELSCRQLQLIDADDYGQLLAVQGRKQGILERLAEWNRATPTLKQRWLTERDGLSAPVRAECDRVLIESESLITRLLEEEHLSAARLQQRRDETRRQLESLVQGTHAHRAYRKAAGRESMNLDLNT